LRRRHVTMVAGFAGVCQFSRAVRPRHTFAVNV
jgi:hypothetical protein